MTSPVFEVREVTYKYQEVTALDGLNLTVMPGERTVLLGANGSGKSTLLTMLDGLIYPAKGSIEFCGESLTEHGLIDNVEFNFRRRVGFVFQNPDVQLFNPSVFDELAFGPLQLRWPREQIRRRLAEIMDEMAITHLKDRSPHHLSAGEKKRVALASVLIMDPEVLLLDEPTAALDPKSESQMIDFLVSCSDGRKTIVTATHQVDLVEDIADCCHVFQRGRIVASGTPAQILQADELLLSTDLVHSHRHVHASGEAHSHPHRQGHGH